MIFMKNQALIISLILQTYSHLDMFKDVKINYYFLYVIFIFI
jgi:hypothetical protein